MTLGFTPPTAAERIAAIGDTAGLPERLRRALQPLRDFDPIPVPSPDDWLANHPEPGQTYERWLAARPNRPDVRRHTIYLQPLGEFPSGESPALEDLRLYAEAFFAMPVALLASARPAAERIRTRRNPYGGHLQLLTTDILAVLRDRVPDDGFALLGITMEDLYPEPSWNFVFGQASLRERVGVYSFARYGPRFTGEGTGDDSQALLVRRSCKVLTHETAHMFGIGHCIFFHCLMNGSNHLEESDARPMHVCPVELRKLQDAVRFDVVEWYRGLSDACRRLGFDEEVRWLAARIAHIA